jgi:hypothetical protein
MDTFRADCEAETQDRQNLDLASRRRAREALGSSLAGRGILQGRQARSRVTETLSHAATAALRPRRGPHAKITTVQVALFAPDDPTGVVTTARTRL